MQEIQHKLGLVQALLSERSLDGALLNRISNFAWITGGASGYVNTAAETGVATVLVTPDGAHVFTNNIEATRLKAEEGLPDVNFEVHAGYWYEPNAAFERMTRGLRLGADTPYPGAADLSAELMRLHMNLLPVEQERFRKLGVLSAQAMDAAIRSVRPGMSECEISAALAKETLDRGALPIVNLIAVDERIYRFRHPLPSEKRLDKYAMLVLCARQNGLVASITRLVHFGPLSAELQRKQEACARIDATFNALTRPGAPLAQVFAEAQRCYADTGFSAEWQLHHQGGPAAYEPREFVVTPDSTEIAQAGQVYAWNPSITGVKVEDTVLVTEARNEVLTTIPGWPMLKVEVNGEVWERPAVLEA